MLLIDTDAVSHLVRGRTRGRLIEIIGTVAPEDRYISTITLAELLYGLERKKPAPKLKSRLHHVLRHLEALPFDEQAAGVYARIRVQLERAGRPLHHADLQIGAIALSRGLRLLTGNVKHFSRIQGLEVEGF
jgi:predicted nucleic acid-binding protein